MANGLAAFSAGAITLAALPNIFAANPPTLPTTFPAPVCANLAPPLLKRPPTLLPIPLATFHTH